MLRSTAPCTTQKRDEALLRDSETAHALSVRSRLPSDQSRVQRPRPPRSEIPERGAFMQGASTRGDPTTARSRT